MTTLMIEKLAYQAREQFETGVAAAPLLVDLYARYADVGDTFHFVNKAKELFPRGNCGLASLYLKEQLGGEVIQGKYGGQNHTFLHVDDTIVDITADQFGGPKVYVGPLQSPWSLADTLD